MYSLFFSITFVVTNIIWKSITAFSMRWACLLVEWHWTYVLILHSITSTSCSSAFDSSKTSTYTFSMQLAGALLFLWQMGTAIRYIHYYISHVIVALVIIRCHSSKTNLYNIFMTEGVACSDFIGISVVFKSLSLLWQHNTKFYQFTSSILAEYIENNENVIKWYYTQLNRIDFWILNGNALL